MAQVTPTEAIIIDEAHKSYHAQFCRWTQELVAKYRARIQLENVWSIQIGVCCPHEMPNEEGLALWDHEAWYAEIKVRCDLPAPLLRWVIVHELYELYTWKSGDVFLDMLATLPAKERASYDLRLRRARNQEIEQFTSFLLGEARPGRLIDTPTTMNTPRSSEQLALAVDFHGVIDDTGRHPTYRTRR